MSEPKGYPTGYGDRELRAEVIRFARELDEHSHNINEVLRRAPLVEVGIVELMRRNANKMARASLVLSATAVVVAVIAIFLR